MQNLYLAPFYIAVTDKLLSWEAKIWYQYKESPQVAFKVPNMLQ
jgi:hypothetical protein